MSERLDEATKGRITAQNEAGEAKSELVIVQVPGLYFIVRLTCAEASLPVISRL